MTAALASVAPRDLLAEGCEALFMGDSVGAAHQFQAAAQAAPGDYESRYWLYSALLAAGAEDVARQVLDEARTLQGFAVIRAVDGDVERMQTDRAYARQIGRQLYAANLMGAASVAFGWALANENFEPDLLVAYGLSLQHQGRMEEAINAFSVATKVVNNPQVHEFLLYARFYGADSLNRVSQEARRWSQLYAEPLKPIQPAFSNDRNARRPLRVGYVGPSFTRNQVAQFLAPVLEAHDPAAVQVFLYCADADREERLPAGCQVRSIGKMDDEAVAACIRGDQIDILVDVWGHTAGSRLPVFARRPAPVQIAWINFVQTTGLSTMDYVLHADSMDVPGTEQYFTEQIWRLGPIMAPYRPHDGRPAAAATPALRNGYVTYGAFGRPSKLSEDTVKAWSHILCARPQDRLVLKYQYFDDPVLRRATIARFAAYRVRCEQLEFSGHSKGEEYLQAFQQIDLALDTSPCPGGTTSCDALANGVPMLTRRGEDFFSRIGVPVLEPCGLGELIAEDWDDYVGKALALTHDHHALDGLRARVRPAFEASPYRDETGFTRRLEASFRQMFGRWAETAA